VVGFLAHPDVNSILHVAGYVFWNPSALDVEANWGDQIGFVEAGVKFEPGYRFAEVREEEPGEELRKKIYLGSSPRITAVFKSWNAVIAERIFPGLGASTPKIEIPGGIKPGTEISTATYSKPLLFVPQDTVNNPCVLLQRACPNIAQTAKIMLSHGRKAMFPAVFDGIRKTSGAQGIGYMGPLSGATLV